MRKALIVIDVQKYFENKQTKPIIRKVADYLAKNSRQYQKIYFTVFKNDSQAPLWQISNWHGCQTAPDTNICDELKPFVIPGSLFYKNTLSAGKIPAIQKSLQAGNIDEVYLCGFDTDCCVLATAYDLFDQNLKPVILENLTWSTAKEKLHLSAIKMAKRNIGFVKKI